MYAGKSLRFHPVKDGDLVRLNIYCFFDPNHLIYTNKSKCKLDLLFKDYNPWDQFAKAELRR